MSLTLQEVLNTSAQLRASEVVKQTGWPADLLVIPKDVTCDFLEAIGLRIDVDEDGVFDVSPSGEFTFAEIVADWRAEAQEIFDDLDHATLNISEMSRRAKVTRRTMYRMLDAEVVSDALVFCLIGEQLFTYRGIWELKLY